MRHPSTAVAFEWDDDNERELARHGVRAYEVEAVFWNGPAYRRNKRQATATWEMTGTNNGGRNLKIFIIWANEDDGLLRAITGWPI